VKSVDNSDRNLRKLGGDDHPEAPIHGCSSWLSGLTYLYKSIEYEHPSTLPISLSWMMDKKEKAKSKNVRSLGIK